MADKIIENTNAIVQTGEKLCPQVRGEQPTLAPSSSLPKLHPIDEARQRQQQIDLQSVSPPTPKVSLFTGKRQTNIIKPEIPKNEIENKDHYNRNAQEFAADPWANTTPLSYNDGEFQKEIFSVAKQQQKQHTREKEKLKNQIDNPRPVPEKKQLTKIPGTGENRDVKPLYADDDDCYKPDDSSSEPSVDNVKIGQRDDPESDESGEEFSAPQKILVDKTPFLPYLYSSIAIIIFLKSLTNTTRTAIDLYTTISPTKINFILSSVIVVAKYMSNFYFYFQSHYLSPQVNTYLIRNDDMTMPVVRHEKNRLTQNTNKGFATYNYESRIEFPIKHWLVSYTISGINWLTRKFNLHFEKDLPKIRLPKEVPMPAFLRNLSHNRFYEVKHGMLKPKKLRVNIDLLQRIMTTKAINYHLPIEQQMKTVIALTNNQSDINLSNKEFKNSTVSDTLTLAKFQLLNKTGEIAEMGFEQASIQLQRNMVIDTTQLHPNGGLRSQSNRSQVLQYDPPEIFQKGLTVVVLSSVILGSLLLVTAYLTRTSPTQLVPFLVKLKDQLLKFLSLNLGPKEWGPDYSTRGLITEEIRAKINSSTPNFSPLEQTISFPIQIRDILVETVSNFVGYAKKVYPMIYQQLDPTEKSTVIATTGLLAPLFTMNCLAEIEFQDAMSKTSNFCKLTYIQQIYEEIQQMHWEQADQMEIMGLHVFDI